MNTPRFKRSLKHLLVSSFLGMSVYAATIVDTGLKSSPSTSTANLINPTGISLTAATGSTAEATVEAISGLYVIQDFSSSLTGGTNVFSFTDTSLPDIQTSFSAGVTSTTGVRLTNSAFVTSGSDSMRIQGDHSGTFVMIIDFGVWSGSSFASTGATVDAAAFTLRGNGSEFASFVAEFLDESNTVISTQTLGGTNGYFGLSASGISSIVLTFNPYGSNDGPLGFDDLAFTASGSSGGNGVEVIVDNTAAEFTGTWTVSSYAANYYGSNYCYNVAGTGADKIRWRPDLVGDDYNVYVWLPNGSSSRPDDAPFTVYDANGSTTYLVNERGVGGSWVLLGTHTFNTGTSGYVELTDDASYTHVIADAVRFEPYVESGPPPSNDGLYGARGVWASDTPAADATPTATYSNFSDLQVALRTANPGDVFYLSSFVQYYNIELKDATAKANLASFGPNDPNVLVRAAPGAIVRVIPGPHYTDEEDDDYGGVESFLPNITWAYFKLDHSFALRQGSNHSRVARMQMGPGGKLSVTSSSYIEFVECLKPVRGENGDTMVVNGTVISGVLQEADNPRDILWDSCWLEGNTVTKEGEHSDTIQWLCSQGTMTFRNCYIGPAGKNASFQFNLTHQPSGVNYALFDLDTVFMGGAEIYGNGNVLGSFHTPAILRRVEYYEQLTSVPDKPNGDPVPFALPAVFEYNRVTPSNVTLAANVGGGTLSGTFPNNEYGATVVIPTFVEPSWWD